MSNTELTKLFADKNWAVPYIINHTICGYDVFLYFGSLEDAKRLAVLEEITDMEAYHITPEDIVKCRHCQQRIRPDNILIIGGTAKQDKIEISNYHLTEYYDINKDEIVQYNPPMFRMLKLR